VAEQQQRWYVSTDPNFGEPITPRGDGGYVSTDPNFGEPVQVKSRTWADRAGMNEPTSSMLTGFLRGAGAGALDLLQGAAANVTGQLNTKLDAENVTRKEGGLKETATAPRVEQPEGLSGAVGAALPMVGEAMIGGAPVAKGAYNAIPRAARAGEKFQQVSAAAKDVVVETKEIGDAALRIYQLSERGGSMPKAVRDLLKRVTDPAKPGMAYPEARDFASNISRLSADEMQRLTPVMKREVAQLSAALNKANAEAAKAAGKGAEYKSAMREYAKAKQLSDAMDVVIKRAKQAALPAAGLGGAAYWFGRD
jgi:hypothetical protein